MENSLKFSMKEFSENGKLYIEAMKLIQEDGRMLREMKEMGAEGKWFEELLGKYKKIREKWGLGQNF